MQRRQVEEVRLAPEVENHATLNDAQHKLPTQQFLDPNNAFHPVSEKQRLLCGLYKISDQYQNSDKTQAEEWHFLVYADVTGASMNVEENLRFDNKFLLSFVINQTAQL